MGFASADKIFQVAKTNLALAEILPAMASKNDLSLAQGMAALGGSIVCATAIGITIFVIGWVSRDALRHWLNQPVIPPPRPAEE